MIKRIISAFSFALTVALLLTSCGIQIGSFSFGGEYYSTPKEAIEKEEITNYVAGKDGYREIREDGSVYKINDDYSIYFAIVDYSRNNSIIETVLSVVLMKTDNGKYHYMGSYTDYSTEILRCTSDSKEKEASGAFTAEGEEINYCFGKKDFFDRASREEKYVFYDGEVKLDGEIYEITVAVPK